MKQKIDVRAEFRNDRHDDSFFTHFFLNLLVELQERDPEAAKKFDAEYKANEGVIDADLKINGVDWDVFSFVKDIERQMEYMVNKKAQELVDRKLTTLNNTIYTLDKAIRSEARKVFSDIKFHDEEEG